MVGGGAAQRLLLPLLALVFPRAAQAAVRNMTIYRVTPRNYSTPINMNTADAAGDSYFGLFKMGFPAACRNDTQGICSPSTKIPGFNVYIKFEIEVDDRFGPYSQCNPDTGTGIYNCTRWFGDGGCWFNSTSHPEWREEFAHVCKKDECACPALLDKAVGAETLLESAGPVPKPPPHWPAQCKVFTPLGQTTYTGPNVRVIRKFHTSHAGCCAACSASVPPHVPQADFCMISSYYNKTGVCKLLHVSAQTTPTPDPDVDSAYQDPPATPAVQVWTSGFMYLQKVLMPGTWYSTRDLGMCKHGEVVGRDCWWRLLQTSRIVNSTCVDERMIQSIIQRNQTCFDQCEDPTDRNSDCWVLCFFSIIQGSKETPGITRADALKPFEGAFLEPSAGGCPSVPPCKSPCLPPCWAVKRGQPCSNSTDTDGESSEGDAAAAARLSVVV